MTPEQALEFLELAHAQIMPDGKMWTSDMWVHYDANGIIAQGDNGWTSEAQ
jgi:hypothetical protein